MKKFQWKGRLRLFPTLRCTASCNFCNNDCPDRVNFSTITEAPIEQYRQFFQLVQAEQVIVGGGESTLHKDFNEIVELSCNTYKDTIVYTNGLRYSVDKILKLSNYNLHLCLSYHPTEITKEKFLDGYKRLESKDFRFYWISAVEDRYRIAKLKENIKWLQENGIKNISIVSNWYYELLQKCVAGIKYKVRCYLPNEPPISPDLRVYQCHSRMFAQDKKFSWDISEELPESVVCPMAGWCSMCDRNIRKERI